MSGRRLNFGGDGAVRVLANVPHFLAQIVIDQNLDARVFLHRPAEHDVFADIAAVPVQPVMNQGRGRLATRSVRMSTTPNPIASTASSPVEVTVVTTRDPSTR